MLVDLLSSDNYISVNISMIKLFGLSGAVYCSELLSIYNKAKRKQKIEDGYITVDRNYIMERTTITVEEQLKFDVAWTKLNLLTKNPDNPDNIRLDLELLLSLFTSTTMSQFKDIAQKAQVTKTGGNVDAKREALRRRLRDGIQCQDYRVLCALQDWVDSVFNYGKGLSKQAVQLFQTTLMSYVKNDMDAALSIVQIATAQGWQNCNWAIGQYEKDKKFKQQLASRPQATLASLPRTTTQEKATLDTISTDLFF